MSISVPIKIALVIIAFLTLVQQGNSQTKMDSSRLFIDNKLPTKQKNNRSHKFRFYVNFYGSRNNSNVDQILKDQGFDHKQRNYKASHNTSAGPNFFDASLNLNWGKYSSSSGSASDDFSWPSVGFGLDYFLKKNFLLGVQYSYYTLLSTGFKNLYSVQYVDGVQDYGHRLIYKLESNLFNLRAGYIFWDQLFVIYGGPSLAYGKNKYDEKSSYFSFGLNSGIEMNLPIKKRFFFKFNGDYCYLPSIPLNEQKITLTNQGKEYKSVFNKTNVYQSIFTWGVGFGIKL